MAGGASRAGATPDAVASPGDSAGQPRAPTRWSGITRSETRLRLALGVCALVLLAAFAFYAFVVPQTPGRLARPSAALVEELSLWSSIASSSLPVPRGRQSVAAALIVGAAAAFVAYAAALALTWRRPLRRSTLVAVAVASLAFFVVAALALPTVNTDIYDYISFGRVRAVHGANPYDVPPSQFPDDPIYPYTSPQYTDDPDNKLPAWMLLNVGLAKLVGGDPVTSVLAYRFAFLTLNGLNVLLVALILGRIKPEYALAGVVAYGWNPIVAVHGQSKTDTVMVLFLLLAAFALVAERRRLAAVALALSVCVKLITFPLAAVHWLRELTQRRWRELAVGTALFVLVVAAVYAPFGGPELLAEHVGLRRRGGSVAGEGSGVIQQVLDVGLVLLVLGAGVVRATTIDVLFRRWFVVTLLVALFFGQLAASWYLMTLIAVASLAARWWASAIVVVLTGASFFLNSWRSTASGDFQLPELMPGPARFVYLILLGVAGIGAATFMRRRRRRLRSARARRPV